MHRSVQGMLVLITALVIWASATTVNRAQQGGQTGEEPKVAVVDLMYVFNESEQIKVLNQQRQQYLNQLGQEADKRLRKLRVEKETRDAHAPDSAGWYERDKVFTDMKIDNTVWEMTKKEQMTQQHMRWVRKTYRRVLDEVRNVAQSKGIHLVVTREGMDLDKVVNPEALSGQILSRKVVYCDPAVDMTNEVLARVNETFEKEGGAKSVKFSS